MQYNLAEPRHLVSVTDETETFPQFHETDVRFSVRDETKTSPQFPETEMKPRHYENRSWDRDVETKTTCLDFPILDTWFQPTAMLQCYLAWKIGQLSYIAHYVGFRAQMFEYMQTHSQQHSLRRRSRTQMVIRTKRTIGTKIIAVIDMDIMMASGCGGPTTTGVLVRDSLPDTTEIPRFGTAQHSAGHRVCTIKQLMAASSVF